MLLDIWSKHFGSEEQYEIERKKNSMHRC